LDDRPRQLCRAPGAQGELVGDVRVVAAEELVAALPREGDLDLRRGELRDEVGRQGGRVGEWLVERVRERGQQERGVRPQDELTVLRRVALRDGARVAELVERALLEADREGPNRLAGFLRRERGERRGVDAAG